MKLSRNRLRQIILEELMSEDDMSLFDPQPGDEDFSSDEESATSPDKQKEQLEMVVATVDNINMSAEKLAEMARSVGWGELETHVPSLFPALRDLKEFAADLEHRLKG